MQQGVGVFPLFKLIWRCFVDIASKVRDLIKDDVEKEGYILDTVEYVKEDGNYYLRVIIDKNGIIDINDCMCRW